MLDMGLWGSSALPPLLSPRHFRDTSSLSPDASLAGMVRERGSGLLAPGPPPALGLRQGEERVSDSRDTSTAAVAVELHGYASVKAEGDEEGSGGAGQDRLSGRSRGDGESSAHPSPSTAPRKSKSFVADDALVAPPPRLSLAMRSGSYRNVLPRPPLLQLYQVCAPPPFGVFIKHFHPHLLFSLLYCMLLHALPSALPSPK